jgi:lipid-binding SYLF domain-containing protein
MEGEKMKDTVSRIKAISIAVLAALICVMAAGPQSYAAEATDEQALVDKAQVTFRECLAAPEMAWFRDAIRGADGVMIVPGLLKAGLLFGGSGGKAVFFAKDANTGKWLGPAFYGLGSFSVGLQAGVEKSDVILLAMTKDAVKALVVPQIKLGADASVAAGPVGVGAAGGQSHPTAGFVSFARPKGLFVGLTLEGVVIYVGDNSNEVYYGKGVKPEDIFISGKVVNPAAEGFREEIQKAAGGEVKTGIPQKKGPASTAPGSDAKTGTPQEQAPTSAPPAGDVKTGIPEETAPPPAVTAPTAPPAPEENIQVGVPPEPAPGEPAP